MIELEQQIKKANKDFYEIVGSSYEEIDGRRTEKLIHYIEFQLKKISQNTDCDSILDLGCGSGIISKASQDYFKQRYALDISSKILSSITDKKILKITADLDYLPFIDGHLSSVVAFAVLHHCFSYENMFDEIFRILKKGGVLYCDHDLDAVFFQCFKHLLKIYRKFYDAKKRYLSKFEELTEDMYNLSEFYQHGIDSESIENILTKIGFTKVYRQYHWYGLSPITDKLFGRRIYKRGHAPLVKIIALK